MIEIMMNNYDKSTLYDKTHCNLMNDKTYDNFYDQRNGMIEL